MKVFPSHQIWALLAFLLCFNVVLAGVAQPIIPRQDDGSTTAAANTATTASASATGDDASRTAAASDTSAKGDASSSTASATVSATASSASTGATATSTSSINGTLFNITIADGELPLEPQITPGWGVAGVILMASGAAYALVGIKTRWLHCFFSVGFLGALSIAVLIIYVMDPPISNALQGAYVAAAFGSAIILGGASLIFQDILECLGCLLGGFCLSMWLLTLKKGGLIGSGGAGVTIFVSVFSAAGLAAWFSRWTRPHLMIACISFSGATAAVIGIDCYSRAGLKEFWAWIWDLNENLFPLGADTYPLTRGIRVEQAATIIIFLIGIVSQMKLWKLIKERRAKRLAERRKDEEALRAQDEIAGKDVERENARERREWDAVHDPKSASSVHTAHDSAVDDTDSEEKHRNSGTATVYTHQSTVVDGQDLEMASIQAMPKSAAELIMDEDNRDGKVTVRVAVDEVEAAAAVQPVDGGSENRAQDIESRDSQLAAQSSSSQLRSKANTPGPKVVPLPFKVPSVKNGADDDDERSSVATFADQGDEFKETQNTESRRSSSAKRLSAGSQVPFQRLSRQSPARNLEEQDQCAGERNEDFDSHIKPNRDSMMVIYDDMSSVEDEDFATPNDEPVMGEELEAELAGRENDKTETPKEEKELVLDKQIPPVGQNTEVEAATAVLDPEPTGTDAAATAPEKDKPSQQSEAVPEDKGKKNEAESVADEKKSRVGKSTVSEVDSQPASLTKDRLPGALSKVALSYRTNEWAKHLSHADLPPPDELKLVDPAQSEEPVPVDVYDLRKTAMDATPAPAMPRTASAMAAARQQRASKLAVPGGAPPGKSPPQSPNNFGLASLSRGKHLSHPDSRRASSRTTVTSAEDELKPPMSSERQAAIQAAAAALTGQVDNGARPENQIADSLRSRPPIPGIISYSSPQTLIGQRDMLLRAKNSILRPESAATQVVAPSQPNSTSNSRRNSSSAATSVPAELDDVPLSQRKEYMRRASLTSVTSNSPHNGGNASNSSRRSSLNNHMPSRRTDLPSQMSRAAGPPSAHANKGANGYYKMEAAGSSGGLVNSVYGVPGTSSSNLLQPHQSQQVWDSEVQRDMDMQRQFLMSKKNQEAMRRESQRVDKQRSERSFEKRMRTDSQLMEAHREAMRKMQREAGKGI